MRLDLSHETAELPITIDEPVESKENDSTTELSMIIVAIIFLCIGMIVMFVILRKKRDSSKPANTYYEQREGSPPPSQPESTMSRDPEPPPPPPPPNPAYYGSHRDQYQAIYGKPQQKLKYPRTNCINDDIKR